MVIHCLLYKDADRHQDTICKSHEGRNENLIKELHYLLKCTLLR